MATTFKLAKYIGIRPEQIALFEIPKTPEMTILIKQIATFPTL